GRAAVPIIVGDRGAVICSRDRLRIEHLLLDAVADEVLDELEIVGPVDIDAGLAVAAAVAEIVAGGNVTGIEGQQHGRIHGGDPGTPAAADTLCAAVPGALQPA